jgi:hypothetical protein
MKTTLTYSKFKRAFVLWCHLLLSLAATLTQSYQSLDALTDFRNPSANWRVVGEVMGAPTDKNFNYIVYFGSLKILVEF